MKKNKRKLQLERETVRTIMHNRLAAVCGGDIAACDLSESCNKHSGKCPPSTDGC